ncbi:IS3 family transposase [Paenibacillus sp. MER TA 81-3]|uniref:IS3 family transposase n=1 Tax=Paenibacillus sp. MER TA 81-3 TaxID=2939573 RepID=UPI00203EE9EC|nr:IS3 family transposase [Paenibacillus sp. MER TA 81-3]MCM3342069.1 IS3 family transposase [Paenibacillus sp. MER TA 81-3]
MPRKRRTFTDEFKRQMVQLYENGKSRADIVNEYELTVSALDRWIKQAEQSGSFSERNNRSPEENELIALRKENQRLKMENDIFKASSADHGTKVSVIMRNRDKYSVSAMCDVLQISRSTYYYEAKERHHEDDMTKPIVEIFEKNRKAYDTRKIKAKLHERGLTVSRRRIGRIMKEQGLVSTYSVAQYKPHKAACNESQQSNELNRQFQQTEEKRVVVSDLTYVKVKNRWHYILCVLVDLFNREIIGFSAGTKKDAPLVARAFASVQGDLRQIQLFHTDRGSEFKNKLIDETLTTFQIGHSLSMKGCPYDNAVAEATFKVMKTEFIHQMNFQSLQHLELELYDYVNWYNKHRIHGTLSYMSPVDYRRLALKKAV